MAERRDTTGVVTELASAMIKRVLDRVAESVFAGPTTAVLDTRSAKAQLAANPGIVKDAIDAGGDPAELLRQAQQLEGS